jgi:hypothetical protein
MPGLRERQILECLIRHGVIELCLLPERSTHEPAGGLDIGLLIHVLEPVIVLFDTECIYDPATYAELLRAFAQATKGEWMVEDARSDFLVDRRFREFGAEITFGANGERFSWIFDQSSKYASAEFFDLIDDFAAERLSGAFLALPTHDQCYCGAYLPKAVAGEIEALLEEDE